MRFMPLVIVALAVAVPCMAQGFRKEGQAFVWRSGKPSPSASGGQFIRFENGRWSGGVEGGKSITWQIFLWHDNWIYGTLPGGPVTAGPSLDAGGDLTQSGVFSASAGSPALNYSLRLTPTPEGVKVRCEFRKSAPLKLTSGIWLHVFADRKDFTGQEGMWVRPGAHFSMASAVQTSGSRVYYPVDGRRSLCLDTGGYREFSPDNGDGFVFRQNILPVDFAAGETAVAEYMVRFDTMPSKFPGDIQAAAQPLSLAVPPAALPHKVPLYAKVEIPVDLAATYDNPFDPDDIALDAEIVTPSGKEVVVPGFFMVGCRRDVMAGVEAMIPGDSGSWKVRFTPTERGLYRVRLKARDRTGVVTRDAGTFTVTSAGNGGMGQGHGFVRVSKKDPHFFAFDDGLGFFAIGHNLPNYHTSGQISDDAIRKMSANGENYNRWWMSSAGFGIERKLGWYQQETAARVDHELNTASELSAAGHPMVYMMCMDTHQDYREDGWKHNPFNVINGGPCKTAGEWFTNETARKLYRKRLRYIIARWGYSPNILCWEFGNEFEGWADSDNAMKLPWHREMSDYLRSIDPFRHLITTSFWSNTGPEEFWKLPNIDIVQTHCYTNNDANVAEAVHTYALGQWTHFAKPHLFGEFGIRSGAGTEKLDPQGWGLHNALWAGATSFCAGGPMPWWHENYIDPLNLYFHFTSIARFTADLPLGTAKWAPARMAPLTFVDPAHVPQTRDAKIAPLSVWGKPQFNEFTLQPDGTFSADRKPLQLLQGQGHTDLQNPPTFVVNYPQPGKFILHVDDVSNSGLVKVMLDGIKVAEYDLPCGEGLGVRSEYRQQWNLWETVYDKDFSLDIPAGKHRIQVTNEGKDWVRVTSYTFTGCQILDRPNILVCGMQSPGMAVLWIQNRDSDWFNHQAGKVGKVDAARITLQGVPAGRCRVQWWETWKGGKQKEEMVTATNGKLVLNLPPLETDIAVKIYPAR